ncbi:MAG: hypothetical protein GEV04_07800 [Actinophytocola sp.]|nr:hypothetical protein [Actinophytocola sp.]
MWHTALITLHAVAGVVALVSGLVTVRHGRLFDVYLWSLAGMAVFLLLAIASTWAEITTGARVLFAAFLVLAGVMVWRAVRARQIRPTGSTPSADYVDHVGFTLVALFDAFAVVTVLDLGAPIWLVVGTGVAIALAGHVAIRLAKRTLTANTQPNLVPDARGKPIA